MNEQLAESYELEGYTNRPIGQREIIKILTDHCVGEWLISDATEGSILYVLDGDKQTSTKDWQLFDLLAFLNY